LKQAALVVARIGERPSPVAEQLALQKRLGDRRAIHGEERAGRSRAPLVQRSSQQLLSCPALTHQQNRRVAERRAIDELHDPPHRARLGQNPGRLIATGLGWLRFARSLTIGDRSLERARKLTKLDRSRRKRQKRAAGTRHATLLVSPIGARDEHEGHVSPIGAQRLQAGPVARREVHVGNHHVDISAGADLVGLGPARRRQDGVVRLKGLLQLTLHRFVVFHDEHGDN
jgi:hypothetical protein